MAKAPAVVVYDADQTLPNLSDAVIARARVAPSVDRVVLRCRKRGLELHLYRSGKPGRWYARPRVGGERLRLNLGGLDTLPTVAEAHAALAAELLKADRHGVEAIADRRTFGALVADFLADAGRERRASTVANYKRALEKHAIPALGAKQLRQMRRADVIGMLEGVRDAMHARGIKGAEVQMLAAAVQMAWRWGLKKGRIDTDIVAHMPTLVEAAPRAHVLSDDALRAFWAATSPRRNSHTPVSPPMAAAFRLALLTGQRIGAVLLARASELDMAAGVWTIPEGEGRKFGHAHSVPLPPMALAAWREALFLSGAKGDVPVFPGDPDSKSPCLGQQSAGHAMIRLRKEWPEIGPATLHDLRRTARTRISGAVHREDAERWLGHVVGSRVERTYDQNQHLDAKRRAADAWEAYLAGLGLA